MEQQEELEHIRQEGNITENRAKELEEKVDEKQFKDIETATTKTAEEAFKLDKTAETIYTLSYLKGEVKDKTQGRETNKDITEILGNNTEFTEWLNNTPEEEWKPLLPDFR